MNNETAKAKLLILIEDYGSKCMSFAARYEGLGTANYERKEMNRVKALIEKLVEKL